MAFVKKKKKIPRSDDRVEWNVFKCKIKILSLNFRQREKISFFCSFQKEFSFCFNAKSAKHSDGLFLTLDPQLIFVLDPRFEEESS